MPKTSLPSSRADGFRIVCSLVLFVLYSHAIQPRPSRDFHTESPTRAGASCPDVLDERCPDALCAYIDLDAGRRGWHVTLGFRFWRFIRPVRAGLYACLQPAFAAV